MGRRVGIGVIACVAAIRWTRRGAALPDRRGRVGAGPARAATLAVVGLALVFDPDVLRFGTDLGRDAVSRIDRAGASLATLAYTGIETIVNFAPRSGSRGAPCPAACSSGSGSSSIINVAVSTVGLSAYPAVPDPAGPDGVASALGTTWLDAPLAGIAQAIGQDAAGAATDARRSYIGVA